MATNKNKIKAYYFYVNFIVNNINKLFLIEYLNNLIIKLLGFWINIINL